MFLTSTSVYGSNYYANIETDSWASSREIVPLVIELARPSSIVDLGCGTGAWSRAFKDAGVQDVLGVDAPFLNDQQLLIAAKEFIRADLSQPFELDRTFDLAVSLEVAEHLPAARAETFVADLCRLSSLVLFSAAVPGQGGKYHVNEQWPSYWARLFRCHSYEVFDVIRPRVWDNDRIAWWFRQNMLLFLRHDVVVQYPWAAARPLTPAPLDLVHPRAYEVATDPRRMSPRMLKLVAEALPSFPGKIWRRVAAPRLRRWAILKSGNETAPRQ